MQTFVTHPDTLYHLTIQASDGREERISTTAPHPFFVLDRGEFVPADELGVGDRLSLPEAAANVVRIEIEHAEPGTSFTTYNFEVEDCHTYFAGELGAWVHNAGDRLCMLLAAKFERRVDNGQSAEQAFRQIEALAERYGHITKTHPAKIQKHLWDGVDELKTKGMLPADFKYTTKELFKGTDFKAHLRALIGDPPTGMIRLHAHHILFKKGFGPAQQALVKEGQAILRKVGIDPFYGKENLVWAPIRGTKQHHGDSLREVVDELRRLDKMGAEYDDFVEALEFLGQKAARR